MKSFFRSFNYLLCFGSLLLVGLTTSCGVYVPHVAPTPILSPGKVEVQAAILPLFLISKDAEGFQVTRPVVQGHIAYSPINHLLVMAAAGGNAFGRSMSEQQYGVRERQGDFGVGAYTWLSPAHKLYISGMMGVGSGSSSRIYSARDWGLLSAGGGAINSNYLEASFHRRFAQGQLSLAEGAITYTGFVRVSQVNYAVLEEWILGGNSYAYTLGSYYGQAPSPTTYYLDTGYSIRFGQGAWLWTVEGTFTGPLTRHKDYYDKAELAYNTSIIAAGVMWRPGWAAR